MDRFVTVTQGEVFYVTQILAVLEGMERGPAGNTSLAAAFAIARELDQDQVVVVQETEYTGAGKHPLAQLSLAKAMGIEVRQGDRSDDRPGARIVIPAHPAQIAVEDIDLDHVRRSYLRHALESMPEGKVFTETDVAFLAAETRSSPKYVKEVINDLCRTS